MSSTNKHTDDNGTTWEDCWKCGEPHVLQGTEICVRCLAEEIIRREKKAKQLQRMMRRRARR